jgi:hypothetical protein
MCPVRTIENMERETGLEPATSSLGTRMGVVCDQFMASMVFILIIGMHGFSA